MRILAIRGQNLASLAERFDLDFEAEPIRTAGIFAISGPTGAGKSTLLDAMCLALFDKLPRFDHADGGARIGRVGDDDAALQAYDDVRNVLRHGAVEGFAEVDFSGQDGRAYRARWQVRRARGRADGKIQGQTISLVDIEAGQAIGGTKTETLGEIAKRIGLSFQQFRRAVLLAQGDFDTFIKADAKTRAELLERITGTGIYAELSKKAFERKKTEELAIKALEDRLAGNVPLDPAARAQAETAERTARAALEEISREQERVARAAAWHETCARLLERLAEAKAAVQAAAEAHLAEEPARAELALCERAFSVRAELDEARRTALNVQARQQEQLRAQDQVEAAIRSQGDIGRASAADDQRLMEVRRKIEQAKPDLDRAREIDNRLDYLRQEVTERSAARALRQGELDQVQALADGTARALAEMQAVQRDIDGWLAEHAAWEGLVPRIGDVVQDLEAAAVLRERIDGLAGRSNALLAERAQMGATRIAQAAELAGLAEKVAPLEQRIAALRTKVDGLDRAGTQERLDRARAVLAGLGRLVDAASDIRRAEAAIGLADADASRHEGSLAAAKADLAAAEQELPVATARLVEARHGMDLSVAATGEHAQHLRLLLVDGAPCPVCGATEHDHAGTEDALAARAALDQARVAELESAVGMLTAGMGSARAVAEASAQARQEAIGRRETAGRDRDQALARFSDAAMRIREGAAGLDAGFPELPDEPASCDPTSLAQHLVRTETAEAAARESLTQWAQVEQALRGDREHLERLHRAKEAAEVAGRQTGERDQALDVDQRLVAQRLDTATTEMNGLLRRIGQVLSTPVPDWQDRLAADHLDLVKACQALTSDWQKRWEEKQRLAGLSAQRGAELKEQQATLAARWDSLAQAADAHAQQEAQCARVLLERSGVLGGRAVAVVEAAQQRDFKLAEEAQAEAAQRLRAAEQEKTRAQEALAAGSRFLAAAQAEAASSEQKLVAALAARGLERPQAEQALGRGEHWLSGERERLDAVRRALEERRTMLEERQKALLEHEEAGRPAEDLAQVQALTVAVASRREVLAADHRSVWAVLHRDDRIGTEQAALTAQIEARRAQGAVWLKLSDLIGSADGARFRRFAQNLTLVQLITLANLHLADLHPRYELQRAPGGDLVLQVIDRFMADEVRGVHSLSGGERFLISLSLALGLASLSSSHGIRVESLFIDEGFGALDAQSLSMAVSALERLQATGRRIGVISHVDELKERIAVKVEVVPRGGGRSTIQVTSS